MLSCDVHSQVSTQARPNCNPAAKHHWCIPKPSGLRCETLCEGSKPSQVLQNHQQSPSKFINIMKLHIKISNPVKKNNEFIKSSKVPVGLRPGSPQWGLGKCWFQYFNIWSNYVVSPMFEAYHLRMMYTKLDTKLDNPVYPVLMILGMVYHT